MEINPINLKDELIGIPTHNCEPKIWELIQSDILRCKICGYEKGFHPELDPWLDNLNS